MNEKYPIVHIFAQSYQHGDASIIGNRIGLTKLRDALNSVLQDKTEMASSSAPAMIAVDGEGYAIFVVRKENDLDNLAMPYTDELCKEIRKEEDHVEWLYDIIGGARYKELFENTME